MLTPIQYFNQGRLAREDGLPKEACPLMFRAWPYEAWVLGWELGEIEASLPNRPVYEDALHMTENLKPPATQGEVAHAKGLGLDACPYGADTDAGKEWRRGWIAAFNHAKPPYSPFSRAVTIYILAGVIFAAFIVGIYFGLRR